VLHVLAAVAEAEAKAISDRIEAALQAAKVRGVALGAHNPKVPVLTVLARKKGQRIGAQANRRRAVEAYEDLQPHMTDLRKQGHSFRAIAQRLNEDGHKTRSECTWTATQVMRVLRRAA
jgi:DNA invertase Pin-like site-specific DNA recombinase